MSDNEIQALRTELQALTERCTQLERDNAHLHDLASASLPLLGLFQTTSTWSPFQSPEVKAICENLAEQEHARLIINARLSGYEIGNWVVGPMIGLIASAFLSFAAPFPYLLLFAACAWCVYAHSIPRMRKMRHRVREILCETDFAKQQGYTPSALSLESFPWSKTG